MNKIPVLIQREFWEHRNTFVILPAVITLFFILMVSMGYTLVDYVTIHSDVKYEANVDDEHWSDHSYELSFEDKLDQMFAALERMPEWKREESIAKVLKVLSAPLLVTLWFVVFFYLVSCLYDDRKDRSILFWKSLPVADSATVLVKLLTAVVVVPVIYLVGVMAIHLTVLLLGTFATIESETSPWELLWAPAHLLTTWLKMLVFLLGQVIWCLPFYGWIVLVSSKAKSVPLAWIIGLPIAISIVEVMFTDGRPVTEFYFRHLAPIFFTNNLDADLGYVADKLLSTDGVLGVAVGAGFIGLAVYFRSRADEI